MSTHVTRNGMTIDMIGIMHSIAITIAIVAITTASP